MIHVFHGIAHGIFMKYYKEYLKALRAKAATVFFFAYVVANALPPLRSKRIFCALFLSFFWLLGVFGERFLVILGMFWALLGSLGACRGQSKGKPGFR